MLRKRQTKTLEIQLEFLWGKVSTFYAKQLSNIHHSRKDTFINSQIGSNAQNTMINKN